MKKNIILVLSVLLMFVITSCNQSDSQILLEQLPDNLTPLEQLPDNYSLEQAKKDGCVTHENGDVTQGKEIFEAFYNTAKSGKTAEVRLAFYYALDDPSRYDPEYYESIKDDYPCLFIQDLSFDGEQYTIHWYEDGEEIIRHYLYIMKYEGQAESLHASYKSYIRYVLTNDDKVTWQELMDGLLSSQLGDYIEHKVVCIDLIYE